MILQMTPTAVSSNPCQLNHLGVVNDRYMPWGAAGNLAINPLADNNAFNLAYKDPLVYGADDWDFPTNQTLNASWLGQESIAARPGKPVFLKSTNILELTKMWRRICYWIQHLAALDRQ